MITFLSSPKGFRGVAEANQRNAIQSWLTMHPDAEVILYGDAPGAAEAAADLGATHVPSVATSESGVPLFGAIVEDAKRRGRYDVQVYLNCDILLTGHLADAIVRVPFDRFLLIGQRIDLWDSASIVVERSGWAARAASLANDARASLHAPSGIDYFAFRRGMWDGLGPLVVGRAGYDSALLAFCLRRDIPVIDATLDVPALHQFHDYSHVAGAHTEVFRGREAAANMRLHGVEHSPPNIGDATWRMAGGRLMPGRARGDVLRRLETHLRFRRGLVRPSYAVRAIWRGMTMARLYRPPRLELTTVLRSVFSRP